jgi:hypothetical protein
LRKAEGADLVATQHRFVSAIMTGRLQASTDQQVDGLVAAELGPRPQISSPGGASLVAWYSMTVHGNHATVDAAVETWLQVDTLEETPTGFRLTSIINQSEIEGKATLLRVNGIWKVATLDQAPWQEVT